MLAETVDVKVRRHEDYINTVGIALGVNTMIITDSGHSYGEDLGKLHRGYVNWSRIQARRYNRNKRANPGRIKYNAGKTRYEERIHSYINQELNRFFREEKPAVVYMVKLPKPGVQGRNKWGNHYLAMWQRGCIGATEKDKSAELFVCTKCGYSASTKVNTARNVKNRGEAGQIIR